MPLRTARHDIALIAALLTTAENEARALGDSEPGAEHLLLAALLVDDSSARDALGAVPRARDAHGVVPRARDAHGAVPASRDAHGIGAAAVREAIVAVHAEALAAVSITVDEQAQPLPPSHGVYRSEVSTQEVFQQARRLARRSPSGLRSAHVLLAVAEREHGTAARVLAWLGLERASVIDAARRALDG